MVNMNEGTPNSQKSLHVSTDGPDRDLTTETVRQWILEAQQHLQKPVTISWLVKAHKCSETVLMAQIVQLRVKGVVERNHLGYYIPMDGFESEPLNLLCCRCNRMVPRANIVGLRPNYYPHTRHRCKDCVRLKDWYQLDWSTYAGLLEEQQGVCAICGEPQQTAKTDMLAVDHDHQTFEVRGLLCSACNAGLGHFRDDPQRLQKAIDYLGKPHSGIVCIPPKRAGIRYGKSKEIIT